MAVTYLGWKKLEHILPVLWQATTKFLTARQNNWPFEMLYYVDNITLLCIHLQLWL